MKPGVIIRVLAPVVFVHFAEPAHVPPSCVVMSAVKQAPVPVSTAAVPATVSELAVKAVKVALFGVVLPIDGGELRFDAVDGLNEMLATPLLKAEQRTSMSV